MATEVKLLMKVFPARLLTLLAALLLAACAPAAAPSPTVAPARPAPTAAPAQLTAAPARPTEKPAATAAAEKPAAKPTEKPAAKPAFDEQAVADFYRGKTVKIIVTFPPGGSFDVNSRLMAKYMSKLIPGNPTIIVENMPGAAGLLGTNHVYNVAPQDGTVIGVTNGSATVLEQLFGGQAVQYDARKLLYLGAPFPFSYVLIVGKASGFKQFDQVLGPSARQIVLGGSAPGSATYDAPILVREMLGGNVKLVPGYPGVPERALAIERGEIDGAFEVWEGAKVAILPKLQGGELLLLAQFTDAPLKDLPNTPTVLSFARSEEQRQLLRLGIVVPGQFSVQYFLAPGVPGDRVQALKAAWAKTTLDQEYLAEAKKANLEIQPLSGEQLQKLVLEFLDMPADLKTKLKNAMRPS
ncbi:MAG: hypothetical protein HY690_04610 [Chloroflexi bacterium]|nr:hypothetical protein [Chloroflexota bacterium]